MIPLNFHHLYYFHAVAREGTVAKAAASLYLAQPTVSAQLKRLEKAFGRPLFERVGRRLVLNEDGHVVMRYASEIFRLGRELQDDLRDRPERGVVAVQLGAAAGTPRSVLHALTKAALEAGAAHVDLREAPLAALLDALADHEVDAVVSDAVDATRSDAVRWRKAGSRPVRFVGSPALTRRRARLPWGLEGLTLILPKSPAAVYQQAQSYLAARGIAPRTVVEVPDVETARRLALDGLGAAPLNDVSAAVGGSDGRLEPFAGSPTLTHTLWLATAAKRLRPNPVAEKLLKSFSFG